MQIEWQRRVLASRQPRVQELPLTQAPGDERHPVWSPDRRLIAFSTNSVDSDGNGRLDREDGVGDRFRVWLMDPDGSDARPAIPEEDIPPDIPVGDELFPSWFPDSATLAFVISVAGTTDIFTVNLRTSPVQIQRRTRGLRGVRRIAVAPSGSEIAFERNNQIYLLFLDTGDIRQLTDRGFNRSPIYLPDGRILFESNIDPETGEPGAFFHIWVMNGDGSNKRPITRGEQNDTDPAPVFFTHPNSELGQRGFRVAFTSDRTGNRDIFLTDEFGTVIRQVSVPENRTQEYQPTVEPFPFELGKVERVTFVTNRARNEDIWLIFSFDIFPPLLSDPFGNPELPQITPKINLPGDTITLKARVFDPETGVEKVYAIFKSADDPLFLWAVHNQGFPDQAGQDPGDQAAIPHEVDWFIVNFNPDTGEEGSPPLINTLELMFQAGQGRDINRYWQLIQPYAIELFDDGTHGDQIAGDGIYTRKIVLPTTPRDYYVDIIPFDKAGNFPARSVLISLFSMTMPTQTDHRRPDVDIIVTDGNRFLTFNRRLETFPVLGYDNITGCTSKPLPADKHVLFVSDYACGQKWTTARAFELGNFQLGTFTPLNYPGIPTEAYYFGDKYPVPIIVPFSGEKRVLAYHPGCISVRDLLNPPNFGFQSPLPTSQRVAIWRILCRGPVPDELLQLYLPRSFTDPVTGQTRLHAERVIVWLAPYTGTLWVDRGSLEDPVTQGKLARFLDRGGRLFLCSGQDLAWALTVNGQVVNEFLTNYVKVRFQRNVGGFYGDYSFDLLTGYQAHRHKLAGNAGFPSVPGGRYDWGQGARFDFNWLTCDSPPQIRDPDQERHGTAAGIELLGWAYLDTFDPPLIHSFSGDGCENALLMDTVDVLPGAVAAYTYMQGGTNAAVQYRDPVTDFRIVTFFFPMEALNNGFKNTTIGQVSFVEPLLFRHALMNFIMDFLRTGSITGKVVDKQGNALEGFTVHAMVPGGAGPTDIVVAGAVTQKDGSYEIIGLSTSFWDLEVSVPGWSSRIIRATVHGVTADNTTPFINRGNDFTLTKLPPGAISGRVTELDGTTPIGGATVEAVIVADEQGNPIVLPPGLPTTFRTTTQADGTYRLEGLPNATYDVTASAPLHASVTVKGVVVRPGQETTGVDFALPGEPGNIAGRVVDDETGIGIPGAIVEVLSDDEIVATAETDANGDFLVPEIAVGIYDVRASAPDYKPTTVTDVEVPTAGTVRIEIRLKRAAPGSLSGRVTRTDGTPIGGVAVEVIRPATGEIVAAAVTEETFTEVDGYQRNYLVENIPVGTYTVRVVARGFIATPPEQTGVVVEEAQETRNINFVLRAEFSFPPGIQMISVPYDYTDTGVSPDQLLRTDRIVTWVTDPDRPPFGGRYVRFPQPPADQITLGRGYFVRFPQATDFTRPGIPAPTDEPFELRLDRPGWWLIGTPFPFPIDWTRTRVRHLRTGQILGLREAVLQGWLRDALFTLNAAATGYVLSSLMEPFKGYWVRIEAPDGVALLLDNLPVRSAPSRSRRHERLLERVKGKGWQVTLRLMRDGQEIASARFGVVRGASRGQDAYDVTVPPPLREWVSEWVTFGFLGGGKRDGLLAADLRPPATRPQVWELVVQTNRKGRVTLTWKGLNEVVPRRYRLVLRDPETGEHRYMRTCEGYTFEVQDGGKRLQIIATIRKGVGLRIVSLRQEPMRGGRIRVRFLLTEPAVVEGRLRTLTGRLIRIVQPPRLMGAGEQRITLGVGAKGPLLPKGIYLLELTAHGEMGERFRAVLPLRVR